MSWLTWFVGFVSRGSHGLLVLSYRGSCNVSVFLTRQTICIPLILFQYLICQWPLTVIVSLSHTEMKVIPYFCVTISPYKPHVNCFVKLSKFIFTIRLSLITVSF